MSIDTDTIRDVDHLEDMLSDPADYLAETYAKVEGDVIILGVGGKMGPTLSRMALLADQAAGVKRRIIGVSRFSSGDLEARLNGYGIETIKCDLLDAEQLAALPDAPNIIYMAGMKFGASNQEAFTWAMNTYLPGMVSQRYAKSRIVAFSTGNVYGLVPAGGGGSVETDDPNPLGDYAMSCLGRERIFEHFSRTLNIPMALIRLNYSTETRYGVLVDLARQVWAGDTVNLAMGYLNAIWQGDANAMVLASLAHVDSPPLMLNLAGSKELKVQEVCEQFGSLMKKDVSFTGQAAPDALLNNAQKSFDLFGHPAVSEDRMIEWIADWIMKGGDSLGKPTKFEVRDGKF